MAGLPGREVTNEVGKNYTPAMEEEEESDLPAHGWNWKLGPH